MKVDKNLLSCLNRSDETCPVILDQDPGPGHINQTWLDSLEVVEEIFFGLAMPRLCSELKLRLKN